MIFVALLLLVLAGALVFDEAYQRQRNARLLERDDRDERWN